MSEEATQASGARVLGASVLVIAFGLSFAALALLPIEVPVYIPLEHRWQLGFPAKPAIGMDFYGRALYAMIFGVLCGATGYGAGKAAKWQPAAGSSTIRMLALYALMACALSMFIYCYTLLFK